jgi:hypothetical protein
VQLPGFAWVMLNPSNSHITARANPTPKPRNIKELQKSTNNIVKISKERNLKNIFYQKNLKTYGEDMGPSPAYSRNV